MTVLPPMPPPMRPAGPAPEPAPTGQPPPLLDGRGRYAMGSMFSGCGGLDLGLHRSGLGWSSWFCERDPDAAATLRRRFPGVPVYDDVRSIGVTVDVPRTPVLCGGFPCQDISSAGRRRGIRGGARSGLFFEFARVVGLVRPRLVVVENVGALLVRGMDVVLGELSDLGYDGWWDRIPAAAVGAPHRRDRILLVFWDRAVAHGRCEPVRVGERSVDMGRPHVDGVAGGEREDDPVDRADAVAGPGGPGEPPPAPDPRYLAAVTDAVRRAPARIEQVRAEGTWERAAPVLAGAPDGVPAWLDGPDEDGSFVRDGSAAHDVRLWLRLGGERAREPWEGPVEEAPRLVHRTACPDYRPRGRQMGNAVVPAVGKVVGLVACDLDDLVLSGTWRGR